MDGVAQWASVICIAAVVCTLFELLSPNGKLEKIMRFVLGLFVICAIIIPLGQAVLNINLDLSGIEQFEADDSSFSEKVNEQTENIGKESVIQLTKQVLNKIGVTPKKVEISMDTKEDNSISIVLVTVYVDREYKEDKIKIKNTLEEELGLDVSVVTEVS